MKNKHDLLFCVMKKKKVQNVNRHGSYFDYIFYYFITFVKTQNRTKYLKDIYDII